MSDEDAAAEERAEALATAFLADLTALIAAEVEKQVGQRLEDLERNQRLMLQAETARETRCEERDEVVANHGVRIAALEAEKRPA